MLDEIEPTSPQRDYLRSGKHRAGALEGADPPAKHTMTRAFIAGADTRVRQGIALMLEEMRGFEVVGEAADGLQATEGVEMVRPDVVVMDIDLPGMSEGVGAGGIARACPEASILVLTTAARAELLASLDLNRVEKRGGLPPWKDGLLVAIQTLRHGEVLVYPPW